MCCPEDALRTWSFPTSVNLGAQSSLAVLGRLLKGRRDRVGSGGGGEGGLSLLPTAPGGDGGVGRGVLGCWGSPVTLSGLGCHRGGGCGEGLAAPWGQEGTAPVRGTAGASWPCRREPPGLQEAARARLGQKNPPRAALSSAGALPAPGAAGSRERAGRGDGDGDGERRLPGCPGAAAA